MRVHAPKLSGPLHGVAHLPVTTLQLLSQQERDLMLVLTTAGSSVTDEMSSSVATVMGKAQQVQQLHHQVVMNKQGVIKMQRMLKYAVALI